MHVQESPLLEDQLRPTISPFSESPSNVRAASGSAGRSAAHLPRPRTPSNLSPPLPAGGTRSRLHQSHSMPPPGDRLMRTRSLRPQHAADPEADLMHLRARRGWTGIISPHGTIDTGRLSGKRGGKVLPVGGPMHAKPHGARRHSRAAHPVPRFGRAGALQHAPHPNARAVGSMLFKGAPGAPPLPASAVASLCVPPSQGRYQEHLRVAKARRARSEGASVDQESPTAARQVPPGQGVRLESISGALAMISSTVRDAEGSVNLKQLW